MKINFTKQILLGLGLIFIGSIANAQTGLENVIVEKYYISNAADSTVSADNAAGNLPVGSTTYRIYLDLKQGYKFKMAYGDENHPLFINSSTNFFNNEDRGSTYPNYTKAQAKNNTVMLDSWLSAGAACAGNFGILKTEDDGLSNVINADDILANDTIAIGIPLTEQDGLIAGTPGVVGALGIDSEISVFDATSQISGSFSTTNGAWYCLAGSVGADTTNKVLIAQITTDGILNFELNIQLQTPGNTAEKFVARNPSGNEILNDKLIYLSEDTTSNIGLSKVAINQQSVISIYPNPTNDNFTLEVSSIENSSQSSYAIFNILGKEVLRKSLEATSGKIRETVDMKSFPSGMYLVEFTCNGSKSVKKLIKK